MRGTNAYVPPGARRGNSGPSPAAVGPKVEVPKVSVNAPDGATLQQAQSPPSSSKAPSPAPTNSNKVRYHNRVLLHLTFHVFDTDICANLFVYQKTQPPADPLPAFRDFVTNEKQRLNQKRQALVKSEMDKRMAELVKFSQSFKVCVAAS